MDSQLCSDWDSFYHDTDTDVSLAIKESIRTHQMRITREILNKRISRGKILEAGCGVGNWVMILENMGWNVFGVDISLRSLQKAASFANKNNKKVQFLMGDLRSIPCKENSFDVIVSYGAIEHFHETSRAVEEFFRVLRVKGVCLVTTPNPYSFHRLLGRHVLNITKSRALGYVGYEKAYTPQQLASLLQRNGFTSVSCGILSDGMGRLLGDFWPAIPWIGPFIYWQIIEKLVRVIERCQNVVGGGSYAIGYKRMA
jgi:ubiquinone/menaquinone biosynthesis C-methylase UbiE